MGHNLLFCLTYMLFCVPAIKNLFACRLPLIKIRTDSAADTTDTDIHLLMHTSTHPPIHDPRSVVHGCPLYS